MWLTRPRDWIHKAQGSKQFGKCVAPCSRPPTEEGTCSYLWPSPLAPSVRWGWKLQDSLYLCVDCGEANPDCVPSLDRVMGHNQDLLLYIQNTCSDEARARSTHSLDRVVLDQGKRPLLLRLVPQPADRAAAPQHPTTAPASAAAVRWLSRVQHRRVAWTRARSAPAHPQGMQDACWTRPDDDRERGELNRYNHVQDTRCGRVP